MTSLKQQRVVRRGRRVARRWSQTTGELTAPARLKPDFLIVGAQRCGTTSMFKTLAQHPLVARPFLVKGVHYFDVNYQRGPAWYRGHFPLAVTSAVRRGWVRPLTGESSPYYLFHPHAGTRIARDLPNARLLVLLRDPVERAYSGHSHEQARGFETLPFDEALALEPTRLAGERERMVADAKYESFDLQHHGYLARGQYVDQLEALERQLGRERILVIDSGDFFVDPAPIFAEVCRFLALPVIDGIAFEKHNGRQRSPLSAEQRAHLDAHFAPFDERLAAWWERTPSWRRR